MSIAKLIKYEGDNNTLVWKHPCEDFDSLSQLIVHESQEAVFFMNGQALDLFGAGRHTLETENIPKIGGLLKRTTGSKDPFHCEVYYVNMVTQMGIKWGTDSKIRLFDPSSGMHFEIGASGEFNIRVTDSRKLLIKLIGTTRGMSNSELLGGTDSRSYFRSMVMTQVKSHLAQSIRENNISLLEIDAELMTLSETLRGKINAYLEEYGLTMPEFFVARVVTPDDDPNYRRMREQYAEQYLNVREEKIRKDIAEAEAERKAVEAQTAARMKVIGAQGEADALRIQKQAEADAYRMKAEAEAAEMRMKGYTYQQETARMVGMEALQDGLPSGGAGGAAGGIVGNVGELAGLGVTLGALGGVMGMTKDAISPMMDMGKQMGTAISGTLTASEAGAVCAKCGAALTPGAKFCPECGKKVASAIPAGMVVCPACGKTVVKAKFCPECGYKLAAACPKCGKELPDGTKFCPECGEKL